MRKLLTGVLSVVGLFGVVLALAAPASAIKSTVQFRTDTDAGTYTITWKTQGGCNPGTGTSGASGSIAVTVAATGGTTTAPTGVAQTVGVNIDDICSYTFSATFTKPDGVVCAVSVPDSGSPRVLVVSTACNTMATLAVTVAPYSRTSPAVAAKEPDIGAVAATTFTVTATPHTGVVSTSATPPGSSTPPPTSPPRCVRDRDGNQIPNNPPGCSGQVDRGSGGIGTQTTTPIAGAATPEGRACKPVSGVTKVGTGGVNQVNLRVVGDPYSATGKVCGYKVTVALPTGFVAGGGTPATTTAADTAAQAVPCTVSAGTATCPSTATVVTLKVSVAQRRVFLVQNVTGDAGGATAIYSYTTSCGGAGLPPAMSLTNRGGAVVHNPSTTRVSLWPGRFNVSPALSPTATNDGVVAYVLNSRGTTCEAAASVSGLPTGCTPDAAGKTVTLLTAAPQVILEFMIDCTALDPPLLDPPAAGDDAAGAGASTRPDGELEAEAEGDLVPEGEMEPESGASTTGTGDDMDGGSGDDNGGGTGPQSMGDTG